MNAILSYIDSQKHKNKFFEKAEICSLFLQLLSHMAVSLLCVEL